MSRQIEADGATVEEPPDQPMQHAKWDGRADFNEADFSKPERK